MPVKLRMFISFTSVLFAMQTVNAALLHPGGLNEGDQYRYAFVTSQSYYAGHPSESAYDRFVNTVADTSIIDGVADLNWRAITSHLGDFHATTIPKHAKNRLTYAGGGWDGSDVPIYLLDGRRVASGWGQFWRPTLENGIELTENGLLRSEHGGGQWYYTWTGSDAYGRYTGSGISGFGLNSGRANVQYGLTGISEINTGAGFDRTWLSASSIGQGKDYNFSYYAVSEVINAVAAPENSGVPEPSSAILLGLASGVGAVLYRRKRKALELQPVPSSATA